MKQTYGPSYKPPGLTVIQNALFSIVGIDLSRNQAPNFIYSAELRLQHNFGQQDL